MKSGDPYRKQLGGYFSSAATISALVASAIPFIVMAWYVTSRGGSNFQDDYGYYIGSLAKMWNKGISWDSIVISAPHGPHFAAIPVFFRAVAMKLGNWDAFSEIYASLAIGIGRTALIYAIFATVLPQKAQRLTMLVLTSFLIFAPVQLGLYAYGDTGITMGADHFGFLIGLWGVTAFPKSWRGVALMALGGFISAWSWGMAVSWIIFFIAAVLHKFTFRQIGALIIACALVHIPIFEHATKMAAGTEYDFFNWRMLVGALGRPFVPLVALIDNYPLANYIGIAGIALALLLATIIFFDAISNFRIPVWGIPGAALISFALAYMYQISIVRTTIGAWYVAISVNFWIGLSGLAIALFIPPFATKKSKIYSTFGSTIIIAIVCLYIPANMSFENKTPFLQSRTLSADSCIRNYRSAPTFCEMLVFFWPPTYEFASFARFFEQTQLSSFGENQTWTIQGDWPFKAVSLREDPSYPQIQWVGENGRLGDRPLSWQSHNRLGLRLPTGQSVAWTVTLPMQLRSATFHTRAVSWQDETGANARGSLLVKLLEPSQAETVVLQQSFSNQTNVEVRVDLSPWAGKTVTLIFLSDGPTLESGVTLHYPRIEISKIRNPSAIVSEAYRDIQGTPENTELGLEGSETESAKDILLQGKRQVSWHQMYANVLTPMDVNSVCAGDLKSFEITISMPENIAIRFVRVLVATRRFNGNYYENEVQLPLLKDGGEHTYTIDTKLIPFDKRDRIETIRIYALSDVGSPEEQKTMIDIPEFRLVHNGADRSFCSWDGSD